VTDLEVPLGVLDAGEGYRVRVRYRDERGLWSEWSDYEGFETLAVVAGDEDGDGTEDRYQLSGVDVDGNGVLDEEEEEVCGLRILGGDGAVGFRSSVGRMRCLSVLGVEEPYGFFSFRIEGLEVDELSPVRVSVSVYLPDEVLEGSRWYKYDEASGELSDYSEYVVRSGRMLIVSLEDGGVGDADGVVNGVIVDPSGLLTAGGVTQLAVEGGSGGEVLVSGGEEGERASGGGGALAWWMLVMLWIWCRAVHGLRLPARLA